MKVVIIGYGHAGRAYVAACRSLSAITEIFVVDVNQTMRSHVPHGVNFATRLPPCRFDLAIIATPPSTHLSVLESVIEKAKRLFWKNPLRFLQKISIPYSISQRSDQSSFQFMLAMVRKY